jgi:glycosyltransferase involved in cell wall biosynthesis
MPNFHRFLAAYGPAARVRRLGVLSDEQRRDFFAGIDAFVLPSRSDSFGLVLLEAWANGLPNVVYRAGGPGELVRHDQDGLVARCGDVGQLAEQLSRVIDGAELRRQLGAAGRERVVGEFRWDEKLALVRNAMAGIVSPPLPQCRERGGLPITSSP